MSWFPWHRGQEQEPSQQELQFKKLIDECCEEPEDTQEKRREEVTENICHPVLRDLSPYHSSR